jgi:hypothetical protein
MRGALGRAIGLAVVLGTGCHGVDRSVSYPDARDPGTVDRVPHRGFAVRVRQVEGGPIEGELIAADDEALWLEEPPSGRLTRIPVANVRRVVIPLYRRGPVIGTASAWSGALLVSTLSHGAWLIITMPIAAVVGGVAIGMTVVESRVVLVPATLEHAWRYARFPQGLPPGWLERRGEGDLEIAPAGAPSDVPPPGSEHEGAPIPTVDMTGSQPPSLPEAPPRGSDRLPPEDELDDAGPDDGRPDDGADDDGADDDGADDDGADDDGADSSLETPPIQRPSTLGGRRTRDAHE